VFIATKSWYTCANIPGKETELKIFGMLNAKMHAKLHARLYEGARFSERNGWTGFALGGYQGDEQKRPSRLSVGEDGNCVLDIFAISGASNP
jgi:hypothetical protein